MKIWITGLYFSTTMAARVSISKAKEIDTAIELLKRHILILRSNGSLVKNTDAYKRQLHVSKFMNNFIHIGLLDPKTIKIEWGFCRP